MEEKNIVIMYTDGACSGNPGPGGWGVVLSYKGVKKELYGGEADTTNNRMELMAAIKGLEALKRSCTVRIYTDSTYVKDGITQWIHGWKKNGWKTANKKPVKNMDLWQELEQVMETHSIEWHWVKGHSDHPENDLADALARKGADEIKS